MLNHYQLVIPDHE